MDNAIAKQNFIPTVSVVSPVFNCEKYLGQFIESILSQTLQSWELILVDDGSTDKSVEIAEGYLKNDKRIQCICATHENAGNARNIGLDKARGIYVCFLDSDDYCKPVMLEKMVDAAQGKNADIVLCQSESFSEKTGKIGVMGWSLVKGKIPNTPDKCFSGKDCPGHLFQTTIISPWNKLIRRDLLVKNQIRAQSQIAANDVVLSCMALACAERIYPKFERLYVQRRDNVNSITGNLSTVEKHKCGYTASLGLLQELKRIGKYEGLRKTYQRLAIHSCVWYFLKNFDNLEILKEDYEFLHNEGFKKLDLTELEPSVAADNTEDMKVFLEIRDEPFYQFLYDRMKIAEKSAQDWKLKTQKAEWQTKKQIENIKNSKTYKIGNVILYGPRKARNLYKKFSTYAFSAEERRKENNRYDKAPKRIAFMAFEEFHYHDFARMMRICNIENNYIIAYVNTKAKAEADVILQELSDLIEWHTYEVPALKKSSKQKLSWAECRRYFVNEVITRESLDYVILPSPEYHPDWYMPLVENHNRNYKVIAGVHNLNTALFSKGEHPEIDNFYQLADDLCVYDSVLKETIFEHNNIKKKIHLFPPIFTSLATKIMPTEGERITFTITGNVEAQRKDYQSVVDALMNIPEFHHKIRIVLLGRAANPYAQTIISQLEEMKHTGLDAVYYTERIPQDDFDKMMFETQYIIAPVVKETMNKGILEYYGRTKLSGAVVDIIQFATPAIVISGLEVPQELQSSICRYDSVDDLSNVIRRLINPKVMIEYAKRAKTNSEKFLLEKYLWNA